MSPGICLSKALLVCLSMSVYVCVSMCCVHICVCISVCPCVWISLQGPCVPMRNLFHCVSVSVSVCSYICLCLILGPCQSMFALVLSMSLCVWLCPVGVFVYVPECLCPGLPVSMSIFVCEYVSVCQSRSLCWGARDFCICGYRVCLYPPALPVSPCLSQLVLACACLPLCLTLFVSLCCLCICFRGQQAMAHELRMVYIFKWLKK